MRAFKADLYRALCSRGFVAGVAGVVAACLISCVSERPQIFDVSYVCMPGDTFVYLLESLQSKSVVLIAPLLAALAFTSSFAEDYSSRFLREYLPRCGARSYLRSRTTSVALSGGLVLTAGIAVTAAVFLILFLPRETVPAEEAEWAQAARSDGFSRLLQLILPFFLSGCLWALVGGLLSVVTMNRYMAYAGPFVFYFLLVILAERYFMEAYALNPKEWLVPTEVWGTVGWLGPVPLLLELNAAGALAFYLVMERRIHNA